MAGRLREKGLSVEGAWQQALHFAEVGKSLIGRGYTGETPVYGFFVPGRIEVLGKHTDYAGGSSLLCAVERGFSLVAVPVDDDLVRVTDLRKQAGFAVALEATLAPLPGDWSNYIRTVVRRVAQNFPGTHRGGDLVFISDLPKAAGMSSSSALMIACFLGLKALNNLGAHPAFLQNIPDALTLAAYLGTIENGQTYGTLKGDLGVGTFGGSQDHTAILCSRAGHLGLFAYSPARKLGEVRWPDEYVFAVASSGVHAKKTGGAQAHYNEAARLASIANSAWNLHTGRQDPHLGAVAASERYDDKEMAQACLSETPTDLSGGEVFRRFVQFYEEHMVFIPEAVEALRGGDLNEFGALVNRSHEAARIGLNNLVPETSFLQEEARRLGAVAASAFGAGFGGSVWAMVKEAEAAAFLAAWEEGYAQQHPKAARTAAFMTARPGSAAFAL